MNEQTFRIASDSPAIDDLKFWSLVGHEALSRPSFYELTVLSENEAIAARDILGRAFDVVIAFMDAEGVEHERHCQGHATRFARIGAVGRYFEYRITLRSWFWLLTKRQNSRILQDKTVLEVLDAVFEDSPIRGFTHKSTDNVLGVHKPRRYCVQHQESDYHYLSRLLEDEGIYYWFDAHDSPGRMHLADASDVAHEKLPVADTLRFAPVAASEARYNEIWQWVSEWQFGTGRHASADSNFKAIGKRLAAASDVPGDHALKGFEDFEFPGGYFSSEDSEATARLRGEELDARRNRHWAFTTWPDVAVGKRFAYEGDPDGTRGGEYFIATCTFVCSHPGYESVGFNDNTRSIAQVLRAMLADEAVNADTRDVLEDLIQRTPELRSMTRGTSQFLLTLMPVRTPFRPPRLTPRVRMPGPQVAIVVGGKGKEHDVDEFGRVRVHFPWDRYDQSDQRSTAWIRVSQPWAGKGWGGYFAPRIGHEVIVDFINGDPDRPIIMGRVYNDDNPIPYPSATHSGFKTHSTPNGGVRNFNELRFEDRKDGEQVFIHAERRMDVRVKRNKYETVQGSRHISVGGAHLVTSGGEYDLHAKGILYQRSDPDSNITAGAAMKTVSEGAYSLSSDATLEVNSAGDMVLESKTALTLKVGGSFIKIHPAGITIVGPMVLINSGGAGSGTATFSADHPLDAAEADTGEPGYLDRPRPAGGGGGRGSSSGGNHHGLVLRTPQPLTGAGAGPARPGSLGPFATQDDAAAAALNSANLRSIADNREYGGVIYEDPATGQFYATEPAPGSLAGFTPGPAPAGTNIAGDYHTHGDRSLADGTRTDAAHDAFDSENFSGTDINGITTDANNSGNPNYRGYLGTPSGSQQMFDPSTGVVSPL